MTTKEQANQPEVEQQTEVSVIDKIMERVDTKEKKDALAVFLDLVGDEFEEERLNKSVVSSYINRIDEILSEQMDEIIHSKEFQELEAAWRGVEYIIKNAKFDKPIRIELLDVPKEELFDDLNNAFLGESYENESDFWRHIFWGAYDKFKSHPYSAIITDYQLENSGQDIGLLKHLSNLSERAQVPVIANVKPEFFEKDNFNDVMNDPFLYDTLTGDSNYDEWREFRDEDRSKYLGLCMPRFLGRSPYSENSTVRAKKFNYKEAIVEKDEETQKDKNNNLWCSSSMALAANMVKSFEKWGWSIKLVGLDSGGLLTHLPRNEYEENGEKQQKPAVEVTIGAIRENQLCKLGFIPLAQMDTTREAVFFQVPSAYKPKDVEDPQEKATSELGAQLPYTMLLCRIAHYLKYRQLQFVGTTKKASDIEEDLNNWLNSFVSRGVNLSDEQIARKPLKEASVKVTPIPTKPGYFQIVAELSPHVAIVGMDIKLKLVATEDDPTQQKK